MFCKKGRGDKYLAAKDPDAANASPRVPHAAVNETDDPRIFTSPGHTGGSNELNGEDFDRPNNDAGAAPKSASKGESHSSTSNYFDRESAELKDLSAPSTSSTKEHRRHTFKTGATYDGQWIGNTRSGFGVQRWADGASFEGQWKEDRANGGGVFQHSNLDVYVGEWRNNVAHGCGTYWHQGPHTGGHSSPRTTYEGDFRDDLQDGNGVEIWAEGSRFEGQFSRGKKHGYGVYVWPDGSCYSGRWHANQIDGPGEYVGKDGRLFVGEWQGSVMHGFGRSTWPDGRRYEGQYGADQKEGFGVFSWLDGRRYEGYWRAGRQHGHGRLTMENGQQQLAQWADGRRIVDESRRNDVTAPVAGS